MFKDRSVNGLSLDDLVRVLKDSANDLRVGHSPQEAVHCARVHSKRLAAALHLYKGFISKNEYQSERTCIKRASEILARRRDLDVIRERLWSGTRHLSPTDQKEIKHWLHERIPGPGLTTPQQLHRATTQLTFALSDWPHPRGVKAERLFKRGVDKTFSKAKNAFQKTKKSCDPDDFHRWRIWTKRLFLQLQMASALDLPNGAVKLDKLQKLQSKLGDLHDFYLAMDFISKEKRGPQIALERLKKQLKSQRAELESRVLKRGRSLFKGKIKSLIQKENLKSQGIVGNHGGSTSGAGGS